MTKQVAARRTRRAIVTEAEGVKQSQILRAEGEKKAKILEAENIREAEILRAEGEKKAQIFKAEGYAEALMKIWEVGKNLDENTLKLQYLDALKTIGTSESAKIVLPLNMVDLISRIIKEKPKEKA